MFKVGDRIIDLDTREYGTGIIVEIKHYNGLKLFMHKVHFSKGEVRRFSDDEKLILEEVYNSDLAKAMRELE